MKYVRCLTVLALGLFLVAGCQPEPKKVEPPPPPPPPPLKVIVVPPGQGTFKDVEGVRRIAVALPLERQGNARVVGIGFVDSGGSPVEIEIQQPLDDVVARTCAAGFKQLGFNVITVPEGIEPKQPQDVKSALDRFQADYLVTISITRFQITTTLTSDGVIALGSINMQLMLWNSNGSLVAPASLSLFSQWKTTEKPGPDHFKQDVEDLLQRMMSAVAASPQLRTALGVPPGQ